MSEKKHVEDTLWANTKDYGELSKEMLNGFSLCEIIHNSEGKPIDCRFLDINPAFEYLSDISREKIIGKTIKEVLPWLNRYWLSTFKKIEKNKRPHHSVNYFKEIDRYFETKAYCPRKDHIIMIFTDITISKKAEEEKKHLQSQLIQSQKLEAIGRLAGGIAHDFNNLLTAILGYSDLALIQIENENKLRESLNQIRFATQRAAKLVHQLLIFSREEPMEFRPHNLTEIIENLLKMLKRIIGEDITIHLELDPDLWVSKMDQGQIEQVIMNLAINARDAMFEGGKLIIKTNNEIINNKYIKTYSYARPGRFVCLTMEDTGIGMTEETMQQIFEPFFTTKKTGEGTGRGLSVVYGIIKEHQGWINVSSIPGKGSTFNIYLPASFEKPVAESKSSISFKSLQGKGEKILVVEDDSTIRTFMKEQLQKNGYTVYTAEDGEKSIEIFKKENFKFDLLFTDVVLPDKRGVELVDTLLVYNPDLKILLTSGYLDKKSEWPYIKERNYRFIEKPYTLVALLKAIKESICKPL
jgi:signal transduction histidine kinase/CheY-like chemotaxis protein